MPCLQDWRPSPRGQPTLPLKFAACHAGVMVTLAAAACRTCTSTSPLHAPTRERTQSWCCRLHGNLSHRDMTTLSHLTRTRSFCLKMHHPTYRNLLFTRFSTWNPPLFFCHTCKRQRQNTDTFSHAPTHQPYCATITGTTPTLLPQQKETYISHIFYWQLC